MVGHVVNDDVVVDDVVNADVVCDDVVGELGHDDIIDATVTVSPVGPASSVERQSSGFEVELTPNDLVRVVTA